MCEEEECLPLITIFLRYAVCLGHTTTRSFAPTLEEAARSFRTLVSRLHKTCLGRFRDIDGHERYVPGISRETPRYRSFHTCHDDDALGSGIMTGVLPGSLGNRRFGVLGTGALDGKLSTFSLVIPLFHSLAAQSVAATDCLYSTNCSV